MGVDFYACKHCKETFCDSGDYSYCCVCETKFCYWCNATRIVDVECGCVDPEENCECSEHEKTLHENDCPYGHKRYKEKHQICVYCDNEEVDDDALIDFLVRESKYASRAEAAEACRDANA